MLQALPTQSGTGLSLFGDYGDLNCLYDTVHAIAGHLDEENGWQKGQNQLLMNFAYEIRKAVSGNRLTKAFRYPGEDYALHYYGFQVVWTDILLFVAALRHNAGFNPTEKIHQASLYLLEHVIEQAMVEYDPIGASELSKYIGRGIPVYSEYVFLIYQALHIDFVSMRGGKPRFRKISKMLSDYFSSWTPEYNTLLANLQKTASENNCRIVDLTLRDFPDIKW